MQLFADGRKYISWYLQKNYGFPNFIGMLDGTVTIGIQTNIIW
jgi:hypothetical protein